MSMLTMYQSKVSKLKGEIASLNKKLSTEKSNQAKKSKEANSTAFSIKKNTSASSLKTKLSKIDRLNSELAKIQKNIGDLEAKIASKTKELHSAEQRVSKEQDNEDKKRRDAALKHEGTLTRKVRERGRLERMQTELSAEYPDYALVEDDDQYDLFISHASQDKADFVEPLAEMLSGMGFKVWYDDFVLKLGDSISRAIDKQWTERELAGLTTREVAGRKKLILPVWHNVIHEDVTEYSPTLADKKAIDTRQMNLDEIAEAIAEVLPGADKPDHEE
jgi:DNA repair exonuclease SbcCD ATPase subunit